ncbi:MAG: thioether cross-link-forming SCIFF peptide maturase [Bacillota bacterium]
MIHKFTFDGANIVLDVNSGAVHVFDDLAAGLLEELPITPEGRVEFPPGKAGRPAEAQAEIEGLVREGLLFSPEPLPRGYHPADRGITKALCLHLAHDCNLRCRYCFAGQGHFGGPRGLMSVETGKKALDLLLSRSGPRRRVEVDFFGGEPLLNLGVLKELVRYGRDKAVALGKEIKFTVTTNALLLTPAVGDYLNREQLSAVLSLDGRPEIHDRMRPFPGGAGSYRQALENAARFVESRAGADYYVRGTFTRYNLDFAADVLHLAGLGFNRVSLEPVVAGPEDDYSFREEDLPRLLSEYEVLTRELLTLYRRGRPLDYFHFNIDLAGGPCLAKRLSGCGAGYEYLAVTPEGSIYPCHQFVGRPGFSMGNVRSGLQEGPIAQQFQQAHVYNKDDCRSCWAKFLCSGGCHANAVSFNNSLVQPYRTGCVITRKRLECALYLKAAVAGIITW